MHVGSCGGWDRVSVPRTMGNTAMCKVCGSDRGLRTMASLSALGQNDLPDFYCEEHFPARSPLVLVRGHAGRCSRHCWTASCSPQRSLMFFLFCFFKLADCTSDFLSAVSFFFYPHSYFCFGQDPNGSKFVTDTLTSLRELLFTTTTIMRRHLS